MDPAQTPKPGDNADSQNPGSGWIHPPADPPGQPREPSLFDKLRDEAAQANIAEGKPPGQPRPQGGYTPKGIKLPPEEPTPFLESMGRTGVGQPRDPTADWPGSDPSRLVSRLRAMGVSESEIQAYLNQPTLRGSRSSSATTGIGHQSGVTASSGFGSPTAGVPLGINAQLATQQGLQAGANMVGQASINSQATTNQWTGQVVDMATLVSTIGSAVQKGVEAALASAQSGTTQGPPTTGNTAVPTPSSPFTPPSGSGGAPGGSGVPPATQGGPQGPGGSTGGSQGPSSPPAPTGGLQEGHTAKARFGLQGLIEGITMSAGRFLQQVGRKTFAPLVTQRAGQWYKSVPSGTTGATDLGTFGPAVSIGEDEATTLASRGALMDSVAGGVGGLSGGIRGALGGMGATAPELATVVGLPLAAYEAANLVAGQRQQNAYYQSILGGSNYSGIEQRIQQAGFRISSLGDLTGAQSNMAFQGVTEAGMTGGTRQNALEQTVQLYNQTGASIQSTLQDISIAAQTGNTNLTGLKQAIEGVSTAAANSGMNANVARQNFTNLYSSTSQTITGAAAATTAGGLAQAQANMGQLLQGANLSGFTSQQALYMYASQTGKTYGQIVSGIQSGAPGMSAGALATNSVMSYLSQNGFVAALGQAAKSAGLEKQIQSGRPLTQDQLVKLDTAIGADPSNSTYYSSIQQYLNQLYPGNNFTPAQAMIAAEGFVTGQMNPASAEASQAQKWKPSTWATPKQAAALRSTLGSGSISLFGGGETGKMQKANAAYDKEYAAIGGVNSNSITGLENDLTHNDITGWLGLNRGSAPSPQAAAQDWYMKNIFLQGKKDPVLEQMLANPALNDPQTLFNVSLKNGGTATVNMQNLLKNFKNQANAGTVTVAAAGPGNQGLVNSSLSDILGFQAGKQISASSAHETAAQQQKLQSQVKSEEKNVVTIVASPQLLQWFKLNSVGGNIAIASANSNLVPQSGYPDIPSQQGSFYSP